MITLDGNRAIISNGDYGGPGAFWAMGIEEAASYCTSTPNSTGAAAVIGAEGCDSIVGNQLTLQARSLPPGELGFFLFGANPTQVPLGGGFRCVAAPLYRLAPSRADGMGTLTTAVDFRRPPAANVMAGTWHFQAYYRDTAGGGSGFNLSDGLAIELAP